MAQDTTNGYVIDTSALIDLWRHFPKASDVFEEIWKLMEELAKEGKLIVPKEVLKELKKGGDELYDWVRELNMSVPLDTDQIIHVKAILKKFPDFVKTKKTSPPADADSLVIALAMSKGADWAVIANETIRGEKLKIPYVCQQFNVKPLNLTNFFSELGFKFQRITNP